MVSRRTILVLSIIIALALHILFLWMAPWITMLESDRLAHRISTRFHVAYLDQPPPAPRKAPASQRAALSPGKVESQVGEDPGLLPIEDTTTAPPVDTPHLAQRIGENLEARSYDVEPEPERINKMDARILEIAQDKARQNIDVVRRLVRPSPEITLSGGDLPALRSPDVSPEDISLEPARLGAGLLAQVILVGDEDPGEGVEEKPFVEEVAFTAPVEEQPAVPEMEKEIVAAPIIREQQQLREESPFVFLDDLVDFKLESYVESPAMPGYFRLSIHPKAGSELEALPKDVTIILDGSRSMQHRKLELAARGIADALPSLRPQDRLNIYLFRDTVVSFRGEPFYATAENIEAAQTFLRSVEAQGQTDLYKAMQFLSTMESRPNQPSIVFVVSDGRPTVGIQDTRTIINTTANDNALRNSIFTYGAGNTVDSYMLALLAYRNKGEAFVSPRIQDSQSDVKSWLLRLNDPLLAGLQADFGGIFKEESYPRAVPDFFKDKPIVLYGRFAPGESDTFALRITGRAGVENKEMIFRARFSDAQSGGREIAQGWAFEKAYHLIGEMSHRGETAETIEAIRSLSREYAIRTIYDE
ncbi:MAG: VWA domain-containing protein [Candidatus Hydrogenedens sp.]|jgi:uncharacterized protein YegL|nr:VWA domain-containing protein [Candidatus Hydrogenedens sp.]